MSETATVTAEIRLELHKLTQDINAARNQFAQLKNTVQTTTSGVEGQFKTMGQGVSKGIEQLSSTTVGQFSSMMQKLQGAIMAAPIIGLVMMLVGAVKKLFSGVADWVNETSQAYIKHQQELAKIGAVLQSSGAIAWTSVRQMEQAAIALAGATGHTIEEVTKMQGVLLGFRTITGEVFDRTSEAIADLVAVMGGDLASAANTIGKAIDTPVQGMSALSKQGFVFTEQEKEMVAQLERSGKHLEAQTIILDAMNGAFGGAAKAMNDMNAAQSDLEHYTERLKIAQGEATTGIAVWWTNLRVEWKKSRLEAQELRNALDRAEKADYSQQIKQVEAMTKNYEKAVIEADRLKALGEIKMTAELQLQIDDAERQKLEAGHLKLKAELELDHSQATNALVLATNAAEEYKNMMQQAGVDVNSYYDEEYERLKRNAEEKQKDLDSINERIDAANKEAANRQAQYAQEEADMSQLEEVKTKLDEAETKRKDTIEEATRAEAAGLITAKQLAEAKAAAHQTEANAVNTLITGTMSLSLVQQKAQEEQKRLLDDLNAKLKDATVNYQALHEEIAKGPRRITAADINEKLTEIEVGLARAKAGYNEMLEQGIITQKAYNEELQKATISAQQRAQSLIAETGILEKGNPVAYQRVAALDAQGDAVTKLKEEEKKLEDQRKAQSKISGQTEELAFEYLKLTGSVRQVEEAEKQRAWTAIQSTKEYKLLEEAAANESQEAIDALAKVQEAFNKTWEVSHKRNPWDDWKEKLDKVLGYVNQFGGQVASIVNAGMQLYANQIAQETEILRQELEKRYELEMEAFEARYEALQEDLEARRELELFEAGLISAYDVESAEAELERARQTLNEKYILQATNNLKRKQIEEKFAKEQKALEEKRAKEQKELEERKKREEAELEYRAAMAQWNQQVIQAVLAAALAVAQALAMPWPVGLAMAGVAAGLGAVQVALARQAKPQMQTFAEGGIVGGNRFTGDTNLVRANAGERIVTQEQQRRMSEILDGESDGAAKEIIIYNYMVVDGLTMAETVARYMNDGQVSLRQDRAVI